jgi:ribosomal protein L37AE/L43A
MAFANMLLKRGETKMAVKRVFGRTAKKQRKCLTCETAIEKRLRDDTVYICEHCGQRHFVDVYKDSIHLTVFEKPELRRRPEGRLTKEQRQARRRLIEKVEVSIS